MIVASVCSGIGGAELAFAGLGTHAFMAEIDPFARTVLKEHFPHVQLCGDFTEIPASAGPVDVLVGGTPCQSFSVAGLRGGMADARGNLALEFLRLAERLRAKRVLWENVPGVLSSNDGRDFGAFIGGLAELGYGYCWRVLDAQYFGLAQRRKRVFVVGCLGDWRHAAAVLFEPTSLRGDSAPGREARERTARTLTGGSGKRGRSGDNGCGQGAELVADTADNLVAYGGNRQSGPVDIATAVNAHGGPHGRLDFETETFVVPPLVSRSSRGGAQTLSAGHNTDGHSVAVAFHQNQRAEITTNDTTGALNSGGGKPGQGYPAAQIGSAVRRLTPTECERLQGYPDGWTDVAWRGKPAADGPRYKALGNAFAVPVVRWIARRIAAEATP